MTSGRLVFVVEGQARLTKPPHIVQKEARVQNFSPAFVKSPIRHLQSKFPSREDRIANDSGTRSIHIHNGEITPLQGMAAPEMWRTNTGLISAAVEQPRVVP